MVILTVFMVALGPFMVVSAVWIWSMGSKNLTSAIMTGYLMTAKIHYFGHLGAAEEAKNLRPDIEQH